jgi:demethylmenaquinone methyltransferase/2-methoxy-6-polyprenyl-1,4-benzoquinol methylase
MAPNKPTGSGEEHAGRVSALFTRIARRYDLINDLQSLGLHRYWKRRVVQLAMIQAGNRALDVCCGTGDLALGLAREGAMVVGLDFSQEMLAIAQAKVRSLESKVRSPKSKVQSPESKVQSPEFKVQSLESKVQFVRGDAQNVPFPDNSFDVVTVGYGLRNLTSWEKGLSEMHRVAKPGGRLLVLDFGKPDNAIWRGLYFGYLKLFVPLLGRLFCGDAAAYAYILESLKQYPAQRGVAAKMHELGLNKVQTFNLMGGAMSINYAEKPRNG